MKEYRIYMNIELFDRLNEYVESVGYQRSRIIEKMIKEYIKYCSNRWF